MSIIYIVRNKINKKIYIGKTKYSLEKRKKQHFQKVYKVDTVFYRALKKYEVNKFTWEVLYKAKESENLNELEIKFIDKYNSHITRNGYNSTYGGDGGDTYTNNQNLEEIKRKLSLKFRGTNNPMYGVHRMGKENPFYGKKHNQKVKDKISEVHKNKIVTTETKNKISIALKGYEKSIDHKNKIAISHTGLRLSNETKEKLSKIKEIYTYELISPEKEKFIISNLNRFCKEHGLLTPCMQRLVNGKIVKNGYKGWKGKILNQI